MARIEEPNTIKRYGNSRLKAGEDLTTIVLKQIIAERVHHG